MFLEGFSEEELVLVVVIEQLVLVEGLYAGLAIHVYSAQLLNLSNSAL